MGRSSENTVLMINPIFSRSLKVGIMTIALLNGGQSNQRKANNFANVRHGVFAQTAIDSVTQNRI